jgi:hypothetical protein
MFAKNIFLKVTAGALIPALATVIFNTLNFIFENFNKTQIPPITESVFEFGVGCAFSLVGICVASKDQALTNKFLIFFVLLLLFLLGGQMLILLLGWNKLFIIWVGNLVSLILLAYAIAEVG